MDSYVIRKHWSQLSTNNIINIIIINNEVASCYLEANFVLKIVPCAIHKYHENLSIECHDNWSQGEKANITIIKQSKFYIFMLKLIICICESTQNSAHKQKINSKACCHLMGSSNVWISILLSGPKRSSNWTFGIVNGGCVWI